MRRGVVILVAAVAAIGILAGGLGWLLTDARPPAGASRAERLYYAYCAECHGTDGRGSWRAALFLLRPGDLTDRRVAVESDRYLFDLIKHGGASIGRPGMPAFGAQLSDADVESLVGYVRTLASTRTAARSNGAGPAGRGAAPRDPWFRDGRGPRRESGPPDKRVAASIFLGERGRAARRPGRPHPPADARYRSPPP